MLIKFEEILKEDGVDLDTLRIDDTRDQSSRKNFFLTKPQGIIIQDSYNNFAFPIRPLPRVDTNKNDFLIMRKTFKELYINFDHRVLPWHFVIEMLGNTYVVYNTRPLTTRYPLKHDELIKRRFNLPFHVEWNVETVDFMEKRRFLIEEAIHVCILGDTSLDVYPKQFYKILGQHCIRPFIHWFKLPQTSKTRTFSLNTGSKFNFEYLFKFMYL